MSTRVVDKWKATPFDPNDPRDAASERARKILVRAAIDALAEIDAKTGEDLQDVAGGLLLGLVGIMRSLGVKSDQNDASLRAGLIQLVPWAVDLIRDMDGLPPLGEA